MLIDDVPTDVKASIEITVTDPTPLVEPYTAIFQVRRSKGIGIIEGLAAIDPKLEGFGRTWALVRPHIGNECSAWIYTRRNGPSTPEANAHAIERPTPDGIGGDTPIEPLLSDGLTGIIYELFSQL